MSVDVNQLREMMTQDGAAVAELKTLLERERTLLETRDHEELPALVERKSILIDAISQHAQMRQRLLQLLKLPQNAEGWDLFLQRNTQTLPLRDGWKALVDSFAECQAMNDINGKMLSRSRQTLGHLLGLLRGQVAAPSLYNAKGSQAQQSSSFTVAKA